MQSFRNGDSLNESALSPSAKSGLSVGYALGLDSLLIAGCSILEKSQARLHFIGPSIMASNGRPYHRQ